MQDADIIENACRARWDASPAHIKWDQIPESWKEWHRGLAAELLKYIKIENQP